MHTAAPPRVDPYCAAGNRCHNYDHARKHPAFVTAVDPLCPDCLRVAERATGCLVYDYLDLAQLQYPSLSQALDGQRGGRQSPPMPLAGAPEALQAEIVHVLTTWEAHVREVAGLSKPARVPAGTAVQRAVTILTPRLPILARIGPTQVSPTGCEDPARDMTGSEAVLAIQQLHHRARAMLGRTRRTFWVPGDCSHCGASDLPGRDGPLYRSEPKYELDEPPVFCDRCGKSRTYDDYQRYLTMLVWPLQHNTETAA